MAKLTVGQVMPDFNYRTVYEENCGLARTASSIPGKTAIVFLRYYGCSLCQLDLHTYAQEYSKITASGGQLLVVLQSDPAKLAEQIAPETFPFPIICDPDMKLYELLCIAPAQSMAKMMSFSAVKKLVKVASAGYKHGEYEGNEQQLPAAFVMMPDRVLTYAHYGKDIADIPTSEELAELLK